MNSEFQLRGKLQSYHLKKIFLIFFLILHSYIYSEKITIAVPRFRSENLSKEKKIHLALFVANILNSKKFKIQERIHIKALLLEGLWREKPLQLKSLEAEQIFLGNVTKDRKTYFLNYYIIDRFGNRVSAQDQIESTTWKGIKIKLVQSLVRKKLALPPKNYCQIFFKINPSKKTNEVIQGFLRAEDQSFYPYKEKILLPVGNYFLTIKRKNFLSVRKRIEVPQQTNCIISIQMKNSSWKFFLWGILALFIIFSIYCLKFQRQRRKYKNYRAFLKKWEEMNELVKTSDKKHYEKMKLLDTFLLKIKNISREKIYQQDWKKLLTMLEKNSFPQKTEEWFQSIEKIASLL